MSMRCSQTLETACCGAAQHGKRRARSAASQPALLAPDVERRAALGLEDGDEAAVTGQTLDGIERQVGSTNPSAESFFIHMHDDLIMIGRRSFVLAAPPSRSFLAIATKASACCARQAVPFESAIASGSTPVVSLTRRHGTVDGSRNELAVLDRQLDRDPQRAVRFVAPHRERPLRPHAPCIVHRSPV